MMFIRLEIVFFIFFLFAASCLPADLSDSVTFRHTFQHGINPDIAAGDEIPNFLGEADDIAFERGLTADGFLTGKASQAIRFKAYKNIPEGRGTVAFWMRGLEGTRWNVIDNRFYIFFELFGGGGWLRLYKYHQYGYTFLLSEVQAGDEGRLTGRINLPNSAYIEDRWNLFAFTWTPSGRVTFYINGVMVGQSENFPMPEITESSYFQIGQAWGGGDSENRVMDNITVYNKALSNYEIMDIYRKEGDMSFSQTATAVYTDAVPVIDGRVEPDEWIDSTVIPLVVEKSDVRVPETLSYLHLMYDDDYLYLALRSPIPDEALADPHGRLLHGFFKRDSLASGPEVEGDDCFEVSLVRETGDGEIYFRMLVNTIDTVYEYAVRQDGTVDEGWSSLMKTASGVGEDGWNLEARIPFRGLETTSPAEGDVWRVNFHRRWRHLQDQNESWTYGRRNVETGELQKYPAGSVVFGGKEAVSVNNLSIGGLDIMVPDISFDLLNQGQKQVDLAIIVSTERDNMSEEEISLAPGTVEKFRWQADLAEVFPAGISLRITDTATGRVYYSLNIPVYAERLVDVRLRSYPSLDILKLEGDVSALDVPAEELTVKVSIKGPESVEREYSFVPGSVFFEYETCVAELEPEDYSISISFLREQAILAGRDLSFKKQPLPEWYGNLLGASSEVPPPWEPLTVSIGNKAVACWGREYLFDNRPFLSQIRTGGDELFARPSSLILSRGSGEIDLNKIEAPIEFHDKTGAKVSWKSELFSDDELNITVSNFMEFDGMLWTTIDVEPLRESVELDSLVLVIPFHREKLTLINPYDYSLRTTGYLPAQGWSGSMRPLWMGNESGGVQFFAETSYNWRAESRQKELELDPDGEEVLLKINFIDRPVVIDRKETFAFGFQATPVKPVHPDYRRWRIGHPQALDLITPEKDIEFIAAWSTGWGKVSKTSGEVFYPVPADWLTEKSFQGEVNGRKFYRFPYYQLHETWAEGDEFKQFGDEWLKDLKHSYVPRSEVQSRDRQINVCQAARSHQDFILHGYDLLQKQANPRGYYFDLSQPGGCNNVYHGCGHKDDTTGRYYSTFNVLGTRELVKRIYVHLKEKRPDGMLLYHNSGQVIMPVHGFADILLDGENTYSRLDRRDNRGYENILTLDTYRAEYMGHNFGVPVGLLPQFTRAGSIRADESEELGPAHAEYVLGLILLHDSQLWIAYFYDNQPLKDMYAALAEHNFAGGEYDFIPYWNQKITQTLDEEEAVVSFYVDNTSAKALAVIMNMSGEERDLMLELDSGELGFNPSSVKNACHGEIISLGDGRLVISGAPSHVYRLIVIE